MYIVTGGKYKDTSWKHLVEPEQYGPFPTYKEAYETWYTHMWLNVDNALHRLQIKEDSSTECTAMTTQDYTTLIGWLQFFSQGDEKSLHARAAQAIRTLLESKAALERERKEWSELALDREREASAWARRYKAAEAERDRLAERIAELEADMNEFLRRVGPRWCLEQHWFPASMDPDRTACSLVKGGVDG